MNLIANSEAATSLLRKRGHFVVDDTIGISLLFAGIFHKKPDKYLLVANNLYGAQKIADFIASLIGEENVLLFPVDDLLRNDLLTASKELLAQRLYVLNQCLYLKKGIVVTHTSALLTALPDPYEFKKSTFEIHVGDTIHLGEFKTQLVKAGYSQVNKIDQTLQFASRGDILDVYPVSSDKPIRIEFFGDNVESIATFDVATQKSIHQIDEIILPPANDCLFSDEEIDDFKINLGAQVRRDSEHLDEDKQILLKQNSELDFETIESRAFTPKQYKYFRFIKKETASIVDYFCPSITFICNRKQFNATVEFNNKEAQKYLFEQSENGRIITHLELYSKVDKSIKQSNCVLYGNQFKESDDDISFKTAPVVFSKANVSNLKLVIDSYLPHYDKVILALANKQQFDLVSNLLKEEKQDFEVLDNLNIPSKKIGIVMYSLEEGFELTNEKIVFISSKELFGFQNRSSRFLNRFKEGTIIRSYEDLQPGDYVVHEYYGIGKFINIETTETGGVHTDFIHIQYAGTSTLYVPLTQFRLIRKYCGREGAEPKLSSLNSKEWEKRKAKIKERVNDLADRLYQLYSERAQIKGFAFQKDDEIQEAFENEFAYELTEDQKTALADIKKDMESDRVMDRLLCGDVGFGKTEVAFRAIFKAILSHKQAAILCPTTLLARQHYELALERFQNYGVNIAIISRLVSEKKQKEYINDIKSGKIHLVIGTHRLLSKDFVFNDLGLLVVDEEQRFGVEQKEKIKELRTDVDVLSLSATPIPRTLQLSLIGVRPVSQITTPPTNKSAIQTYVAPFSKEVARELIERELSRKGQVFYIHNVVDSIDHVARDIQRMVPSASVGVVHGKLDKEETEDVMMRFYAGEIDILVATSIIENGIDIHNANLIIVEDADRFGLSQLYQIKGRVGRGGRIAYAYLFYRPQKNMNKNAIKRLQAIQDFAELGSGYKIAQRDLMIRGAGDILGPEQAGFIDSIGLELYLKLLNEVIEEKKTGVKAEPPKPVKMFNIEAYVPDSYVRSQDKIELYQDIENAKNEKELKAVRAKIRDIYGQIPEEVSTLINKRRIDILIGHEEFSDIKEYPEVIEIILSKKFTDLNGIGQQLFEVLAPYLEKIQVSYLKKVLKIRLKKIDNWMKDLETIIECIDVLYNKRVK